MRVAQLPHGPMVGVVAQDAVDIGVHFRAVIRTVSDVRNDHGNGWDGRHTEPGKLRKVSGLDIGWQTELSS